MRCAIPLVLALASTLAAQERAAFQEDLWREYDLYKGRLFELIRAVPEEKLNWRPDAAARSIEEVALHVALNNYMLLDMMGRPVPKQLYPELPAEQPARQRAIFRRNLALEKETHGRARILEMAETAFQAGGVPIRETTADGLNRPAMFGDRKTTQGGLQLRSVAHLHEHLGQLIAYVRSLGIVPPWSQ